MCVTCERKSSQTGSHQPPGTSAKEIGSQAASDPFGVARRPVSGAPDRGYAVHADDHRDKMQIESRANLGKCPDRGRTSRFERRKEAPLGGDRGAGCGIVEDR
jgi:hypothetical protein